MSMDPGTPVKAPPVLTKPMRDCYPILPRIADGLFQRADRRRDELFEAASRVLAERQIKGNVLRSPPLSHAPWVSIEFWVGEGADPCLTKRSLAVIRLKLRPYFKYEVEFSVEITQGGRTNHVHALANCDAGMVAEVIKHLLGERGRPRFYGYRLRQQGWQLWRPLNKPMALRRDWLATGAGAVFVGTICASLFAYYKHPLDLIPLVPTAAAALVAIVVLGRRKRLVRTSGRPNGEPRILVSVDSWQVMLFGLAASAGRVREEFLASAQQPLSPLMRLAPERIWYWGLDGVIDREQIVVNFGRSVVFVHIQPYGSDLYVAWDAHLNRGQWSERTLFRGIDKASRRPATICDVYASVQNLNEYDVADVNSLIEWTHAQIVKVLKKIAAEARIEQEIDFKIIRGERSDLVQRAGTNVSGQVVKARGVFQSLLKRVG